jgi:hypothetical protein
MGEQVMRHLQSIGAIATWNTVLAFLEEHVLKSSNFRVCKIDDSQLWLETLDGFISVRLIVHYGTGEMLYDVFSPKYDVHLNEETIEDVERLDSLAEETGKWHYEKSIEDLWFVLDWIKLWTRKNGFTLKKASLV